MNNELCYNTVLKAYCENHSYTILGGDLEYIKLQTIEGEIIKHKHTEMYKIINEENEK